jgi:hypothetical protein
LLNSFPTWALAVLCVAVPVLLTYVAARALRRFAPSAAEGRYAVTAKSLLDHTLLLYGFVLAFVIVGQYDDASSARNGVQVEALNLEDLYRAASALPEPARSDLAEAVRSYDRHVVYQEWDELAEGRSDADAGDDLKRMYAVLQAPAPATEQQASMRDNAIDYLHEVHEARHRRLDTAAGSLPGVLAVFLLLGALGVLVSSLLIGGHGHRLLDPLGLAALLGFTLFLSLSLEHPFSGDHPIPSTHFQEGTLAQLSAAK